MKQIYIILSLSLLWFASCESFLEVETKGTLEQSELFKDEDGFKDAMYGCYATMAMQSLYGNTLSYGFLDDLGQLYFTSNSKDLWNKIVVFDYTDSDVEVKKDAIWTNSYYVIANLNNVIKQMNGKDLNTGDYGVILGEAYGLRAMLHFDILRMFAENVTISPEARGIPYAYDISLENKKVFKLKESYENVLKDLTKAEELLEKYELNSSSSSSYLADRFSQFNIYAVYALKARAYLYVKNYDEAITYAQKVVDNSALVLAAPEADELKKVQSFPGGSELIFGLYNNQLYGTIYKTFLGGEETAEKKRLVRTDVKEIYGVASFTPASTDYRYQTFFKNDEQGFRFTRFLEKEVEEGKKPEDLVKGINLIRLPEMYYILAESYVEKGNIVKALEHLNEVRMHRGLAALEVPASGEKQWLLSEIMNDRLKEYWGEGHIFLEYKRRNSGFKAYNFETIEPSKEVFVFPWPDKELEYGAN